MKLCTQGSNASSLSNDFPGPHSKVNDQQQQLLPSMPISFSSPVGHQMVRHDLSPLTNDPGKTVSEIDDHQDKSVEMAGLADTFDYFDQVIGTGTVVSSSVAL